MAATASATEPLSVPFHFIAIVSFDSFLLMNNVIVFQNWSNNYSNNPYSTVKSTKDATSKFFQQKST